MAVGEQSQLDFVEPVEEEKKETPLTRPLVPRLKLHAEHERKLEAASSRPDSDRSAWHAYKESFISQEPTLLSDSHPTKI